MNREQTNSKWLRLVVLIVATLAIMFNFAQLSNQQPGRLMPSEYGPFIQDAASRLAHRAKRTHWRPRFVPYGRGSID